MVDIRPEAIAPGLYQQVSGAPPSVNKRLKCPSGFLADSDPMHLRRLERGIDSQRLIDIPHCQRILANVSRHAAQDRVDRRVQNPTIHQKTAHSLGLYPIPPLITSDGLCE